MIGNSWGAPVRRVSETSVATPIHIPTSDYASSMRNRRRIGSVLPILGFLGVVSGKVAWMVSYWNVTCKKYEVYEAALPIGIGLGGIACWRWTAACRASDAEPTLVRGPTRWMAAAAFVLASGLAALTYQTYDNHRDLLRYSPSASAAYPHYRLIIAGGAAYTVGLFVAAIGFLILGSAPEMPIDTLSLTVGKEQSPVNGATGTQLSP